MRGRRPKPTVLKVLEGNPGKRPLPKHEPKPQGMAEMPGWLRPGAVKVWNEYAPRLEGLGLLTDLDAETFGQWCTLTAMFRRKPAEMPAGKIARMDAIGQRFGLDPSSRARMSVKPQEPKDDEARFFGTG